MCIRIVIIFKIIINSIEKQQAEMAVRRHSLFLCL